MRLLTDKEKLELKLSLTNAISHWLENETGKDNNIGWLPDETVKYMTNSAFNILEATNDLNVLMQREDLLK